MHSLRLICWGHRPWGAPVAPQQLEPGGEQAAGGQKHSRLGKRLFRSPPPSQKGGGGFQPQPRCELGCSHPCLPPPVPVLCDRRPVQASRGEAAKDSFSLLVSHPSGHLLHREQGGSEIHCPPPPPGSLQPHEARPGQSRRSLGRKQRVGAGVGDRPRAEASQRQMRFKKAYCRAVPTWENPETTLVWGSR